MKEDSFKSFTEDIKYAELSQITSYLTGNQLALAQQGIDSALLSMRIQTDSLVKNPSNGKALESIIYSHGIEGDFGSAAWFEIEFNGGRLLRLTDPAIEHTTGYEENILPRTRMTIENLVIEVSSVTPIRKRGEQVERTPGFFYSLKIKNATSEPLVGQVRLCLKGSVNLINGGKENWSIAQSELPTWDSSLVGWVYPANKEIKMVVSGDQGAVPIFNEYPQLSWDVQLGGYSEQDFTGLFLFQNTIPSHISREIDPVSVQDWKSDTIQYWKDLLGILDASWAKQFPDFIQRAVQEALLCVRVDLDGNVVGVAPSPIPEDDYPLLCDVLWISFPVLYLLPELYPKIIDWYLGYISANRFDGSMDIRMLVIPALMMGLGYRTTGRKDLYVEVKELAKKVEDLLESIIGSDLNFPGLYPNELIRNHKPLLSIELGTNILFWAAFELWGRLCSEMGYLDQAVKWRQAAQNTHSAIQRGLVVHGPSDSGFVLAGEKHSNPTNPFQTFMFYEGDALEIAIAPYLGFCSSQTPVWKDTLKYMFSPAYDVTKIMPDTILWWEMWNYNGVERQEKFTFPSILAKINSIEDNDVELDRALVQFNQEIDITGALWEKTKNGKRVMRSGRLCGAAYLVFLDHLLGIRINNVQKKAVITPFTTWRTVDLAFSKEAAIPFDLHYRFGQDRAVVQLINKDVSAWQVKVGFWFPADLYCQNLIINGQTQSKSPIIEKLNKWQVVQVDADVAGEDTLEINLAMHRDSLVYSPFSPTG